MTKNIKLLPDGFCDLIFEEAENKFREKNLVLEHFLASNFRMIETSLVEFLDKSTLYDDAFCALDAKSGKNLVFRNDITLQIERLLKSRLKSYDLPIKLCYCGSVLSNKALNFNGQRQQTQIGIEIIGCSKEESDIEVIKTTLEAVSRIGKENVLIEISLPDLLNKFLEEVQLKEGLKEDLATAILNKNISKIREIFGNKPQAIEDLILKNDDLEGNINNFSSNYNSPVISEELAKAQKLHDLLTDNFNCSIAFDLFGDHKSSYHNSTSFNIFADNLTNLIARGGRYQIGGVDAVGSTIYI
ncbi:MAG: ATP phosphoribosyltransferase regulatory subunit [Rickettsiales bacterium]|nr:ATP phosphoribosyltransferase regulatory subunit [Rickettsiales bacterium]